jgi:peroxiredoxin Q/BCP
MLEEGTPAPAFELQDQEGNSVSLEEHRGKWVAVWWFVKASTPG